MIWKQVLAKGRFNGHCSLQDLIIIYDTLLTTNTYVISMIKVLLRLISIVKAQNVTNYQIIMTIDLI